jgi:hypothetical protein
LLEEQKRGTIMNEAVTGSAAEGPRADLSTRTPIHLWIVGVLAVLWNAFGCLDYVMTETGNEAYLSMASQAMRDYWASFPAWMVAAWAVGVWGGLLASLLLLMRSRHAVTLFGLSLLGLLVGTIYQFGVADMPAEMKTTGMLALNALIWAVAIALLVYAMRMRRNGVLR